MKKTVIANKGNASTGKSETIKQVAKLILAAYPAAKLIPATIDFSKDIKLICNIGDTKIGIESQGDPNSRLPKSLKDFVDADCALIICATRTSGETVKAVSELNTLHGYDVIWMTNYRSWQKGNKDLNDLSAEHVFELIQRILAGKI